MILSQMRGQVENARTVSLVQCASATPQGLPTVGPIVPLRCVSCAKTVPELHLLRPSGFAF
jgi:hypothetical protein